MEQNNTHGRRPSSSKSKRRKRRKIKLLIRRIVFATALIVFIVSSVMLIKTLIGYGKADKIYNDVESSVFSGLAEDAQNAAVPVEPQTDASGTIIETAASPTSVLLQGYNHDALVAINADSVGYFQIPALNINLPVVQGDDNSYYLSHTITGENSKNGTLFIDYRCADGIESSNAIIYGHNMKDGSMFGTLNRFQRSDFFANENNRYVYFYIEDKIYKYEIYSVHTTPSTSSTYASQFNNEAEFMNYLSSMESMSIYATDVPYDENSKTITLSTCTNDSATRLVVQAIRIEELTQ